MSKLKILCITRNYEGYLGFGEHEYLMELARQADVTFLGDGFPNYTAGMDLAEYIKGEDYDVIYYSQCTTENPGRFKVGSVAATEPPKVAWMHNGHNYRESQINRITRWDTKLVLFRSWAPHILEYMNKLKCPMKHHPQSVNVEILKDYGLPKDYDVAFPGIVIPHYPFREVVQKRLKELAKDGLKFWTGKHPGYPYDLHLRYEELKKKGYLWREDYAKMINRSKLMITSGGKFGVAVRKYFEAMACRALLLAPLPTKAEDYHFLDGFNMVAVDSVNWEDEMWYYLENSAERERLVENAYQTIQKFHTTKIRIKELLEILENGIMRVI